VRTNHVKQRLKAGEPSVGTWLALPSPECAEQVARLGLDWLVVDAEHNPVDIRTLAQMFVALTPTPVAPMVRIPWNTPEHFKRVLDAGAWGIVVPMVNSREEAERAVRATRYHPLGERSVGGGRHAISFGGGAAEYYQAANDEILLVLQIEHVKGVEAADEILSVPGVDACFIGPNDMAASMGIGLGVPLESDHPQVVQAIEHVRVTCEQHGVAPGIHCSHAEGVAMRIEQGFRFLAMASELRYLLAGLRADLGKLDWRPAASAAPAGTTVRY
jgi:4-hydroxy-2-oxoheptanedioate aldolase